MEKESKSTGFNHFYVSPHKNSSSSSVDVGLRILIQLSHTHSNVVMKPTLKLMIPTLSYPQNTIDTSSSCSYESLAILKSCHLCNNNLSPDKDVYMYRGDQGFCSVECRSRQIYLDEMREIEASTKKMLDSFRNCHHRDGCESRELLEESGQRHTPLSSRNKWPIG